MKAIVVDAEALGALRPLDVIAYLRARGWRPFDVEAGAPLSEWSRDDAAGYFEVQVPRHPTWRDYPRRMGEVLAALSREAAS